MHYNYQMASTPLVSVIIPVFNARKYIVQTIQSVLEQTYKNIETIAIEDGSSEDSEDLVKQFPKIKYLKQKQKGNAYTRNRGIRLSHGSLVCFLDCDDLYTKDKVQKQVDYFDKNPECKLLSGLVHEFLEPGVKMPSWVRKAALKKSHKGASPGSIMVRREVFNEIGMFDSNYVSSSDTEWLIRAKNKNIKLEYLNEVVLLKRIHDSNQSAYPTLEQMQARRRELITMFAKNKKK